MTVFIKDPSSPEVVAVLKKEGKTLIRVVKTSLYLLQHPLETPLEALMEEWFVKYRGSSHACRDGSHIGGSDEASIITVLTEGNRLIDLRPPSPLAKK